MSALTALVAPTAPRTACVASCSARTGPRPVGLAKSAASKSAAFFGRPAVTSALRAPRNSISAARVAVAPVVAGLSTGRVKISVQGQHLEVTEAISEYAEEKIGHALEPFEEALRVREVDVKFSVRGGENSKGEKSQTVECTVYTKKHVFRAEDSEESLYAAIDKVADKLSRKLRKTKERNSPKGSKTSREMDVSDSDVAAPLDVTAGKASLPEEVLRTKYFTTPPMSVKEAVANLERIDHDFYVFIEAKSSAVNVVYKRKAGSYGLIVPMPEE